MLVMLAPASVIELATFSVYIWVYSPDGVEITIGALLVKYLFISFMSMTTFQKAQPAEHVPRDDLQHMISDTLRTLKYLDCTISTLGLMLCTHDPS